MCWKSRFELSGNNRNTQRQGEKHRKAKNSEQGPQNYPPSLQSNPGGDSHTRVFETTYNFKKKKLPRTFSSFNVKQPKRLQGISWKQIRIKQGWLSGKLAAASFLISAEPLASSGLRQWGADHTTQCDVVLGPYLPAALLHRDTCPNHVALFMWLWRRRGSRILGWDRTQHLFHFPWVQIRKENKRNCGNTRK